MDLSRSSRIAFLDSIRGLAALAVLLSHAAGVLVAPPAVLAALRCAWLAPAIDGKAAVAMFFVLSGFVLARPYMTSPANPEPRRLLLVPFYLKRVCRIYLPFLGALLLSAAGSLWLFQRYETVPPETDWFKLFWSLPWTAHDFLAQCFFRLHNANLQFMSQDWSLGVELKASALLPFLLLALRRGSWLLMLVGAAFVAFVGTGAYYAGFTMGIFLAYYLERRGAPFRHFYSKCALFLAAWALYQTRQWLPALLPALAKEKWIWLGTSAGCVLILLACFSIRRFQRALNHPVMVFLGRISYGVYLLQFLVLVIFTPWFVHQLNAHGLTTVWQVWWLAVVVSVGLTILAGMIFYNVVEKPSMRLGHFLASRWQLAVRDP